ncbi:hypothetical protein [Thermodesulforhabdus norvegica]|uniref:Uncharacterized protein n=1 Tax=Thermodesulforhabdus norvegica TaxID=39841 RepID=A0A1I4QYH6_9BACT|nr:hypothetical protein [Thermodesulforhabdus norvegica]SFM44770.1 hypothetical protein SAMN05660836_00281 [Thermodesulforhabdus norvegica]
MEVLRKFRSLLVFGVGVLLVSSVWAFSGGHEATSSMMSGNPFYYNTGQTGTYMMSTYDSQANLLYMPFMQVGSEVREVTMYHVPGTMDFMYLGSQTRGSLSDTPSENMVAYYDPATMTITVKHVPMGSALYTIQMKYLPEIGGFRTQMMVLENVETE